MSEEAFDTEKQRQLNRICNKPYIQNSNDPSISTLMNIFTLSIQRYVGKQWTAGGFVYSQIPNLFVKLQSCWLIFLLYISRLRITIRDFEFVQWKRKRTCRQANAFGIFAPELSKQMIQRNAFGIMSNTFVWFVCILYKLNPPGKPLTLCAFQKLRME